jgi:hypothetical protein
MCQGGGIPPIPLAAKLSVPKRAIQLQILGYDRGMVGVPPLTVGGSPLTKE